MIAKTIARWGFCAKIHFKEKIKAYFLYRKVIFMIKKVNINGLEQIKNIVSAASLCNEDVGVHDANGSIADAKSILGLISLDYSHPVSIVSESEKALHTVLNAIS